LATSEEVTPEKIAELIGPCECCGKSDHIAGVAASGLGPFSITWCSICIGVEAEPKWASEALVESNGDKPNTIYYDPATDTYRMFKDDSIAPVKFKDGTECSTRTAAAKYLDFVV